MNDRIRELSSEAWRYANNYRGDIVMSQLQRFEEKFAELIVKECLNICKEHPSRTLSNNWHAYAVAPDIVHIFEEHFGVEE